MNNKKGFSYIMVCVLTIVVSMFIAVGIYYASFFHLITEEREHTCLTMDSMVTKYAVGSYDALKQGPEYVSRLNKQAMVNRAFLELGFTNGTVQRLTKTKGETTYTVSRPSISAITGESFGVEVSYMMYVPFELFGLEIAEISVPISVESRFILK